eukprot:TRINITY_DN2094_c0_g2_i1.p1 TRINITY_DN2094_c0_g2~~TRINITY_DN2094_c0_g2_i1.p1  ORF type:complete len:150 (+),score=42.08 TRINITY_DN2094_c0_g2_i1:337-786(+)
MQQRIFFLKSEKKHVILIIQKNPLTIIKTNSNIIADFISFDESTENIVKRIKFNLNLSDILSAPNKINPTASVENSPELLKLEMERKNTVSEITDKIAKELTQPLTTLICNAELLKSENRTDPQIFKKAGRIIESAKKKKKKKKKNYWC